MLCVNSKKAKGYYYCYYCFVIIIIIIININIIIIIILIPNTCHDFGHVIDQAFIGNSVYSLKDYCQVRIEKKCFPSTKTRHYLLNMWSGESLNSADVTVSIMKKRTARARAPRDKARAMQRSISC